MKHLLAICAAVCLISASCTSNNPNSNSGKDSSAMSGSTSGMSASAGMAEKNKATAMASIQGFITHDANAVLKDVSPDFVDYGDGSSPPIKGMDSCKAMINSMLATFPDIRGENLLAIADGDHVAIFGDWSGTFKGKMGNTSPTGKSFKIKDVDLFTFNSNGQISEHHSVQSMDAMMKQIMPGKK